jgi:hypothetical protein
MLAVTNLITTNQCEGVPHLRSFFAMAVTSS